MLGRKKAKKEIKIDHSEETNDESFFALPTAPANDAAHNWADDGPETADTDEFGEPENIADTGLTSWINEEDKLPIDVYQDESFIYLKSPVPGADVKDIDITIENDLITVRVHRQEEETISQEDYYFQECFWGSLSRSIILPTEIDANAVRASLRSGILTITLPKINRSTGTKVSVEAED
ncbi:MAG: Hsp20/alpha crystallin family protein [Candidatus Komeilibacteria bacterium]